MDLSGRKILTNPVLHMENFSQSWKQFFTDVKFVTEKFFQLQLTSGVSRHTVIKS